MSEEELIKVLKEMDKKRVEELEPNSRKLFDAIMSIADERDRLLEEKQELIDYLRKQINNCKLKGYNYEKTYICGKESSYKEILSKIEKSDK